MALMRNFLNTDVEKREKREGFDCFVRAEDARKTVLWAITHQADLVRWAKTNEVAGQRHKAKRRPFGSPERDL